MFKGSKNVQPEAHTSMLASVGGQSNAYTTDDETVFWETVPAQYLPLIAVARSRSHGDAAHRQGHVRQRARRREGRAADARRQPAVRPAERDHLRPGVHRAPLQARDDRQHGGSRGGVGRRRARLLQDATTCRRTRRWCSSATSIRRRRCTLVNQYLGRVPKADRAVPRDIPQEPPQTKEKRVTLQEPWPLPAVVVAYHVTNDGNPDSYPLHIAAKVLSDGQTLAHLQEAGLREADGGRRVRQRQPDRGSEPLLRRRDRAAGAHDRRKSTDALIAELDRLKTEPITAHELQRAKNQFARDYILGRESNQQKARQLSHAVVIHNDVKTADGEFDIFQNIDRRRRAARGADLLQAGEPAGAHADAVGQGGREHLSDRAESLSRPWLCCLRSCCLCSVSVPRATRSPPTGRPSARRSRCRRATSSSRPTRSRRCPTACRSSSVLHHEQPAVTHAAAGARGHARRIRKTKLGLAHLAASLLDQGTDDASRPSEMNDADRLHRRRDGRRRRHRSDASSTWS